ncbi:hypothetical protein ACWDMR_34000 [Streptomyces althioticus]
MFGKKRGKSREAGPPVHDDLVRRDFTTTRANRLWLADITEHATGEGKLCLCVIKGAFSNRSPTALRARPFLSDHLADQMKMAARCSPAR